MTTTTTRPLPPTHAIHLGARALCGASGGGSSTLLWGVTCPACIEAFEAGEREQDRENAEGTEADCRRMMWGTE